jgi:hypothetical protein
MPYLKKENENKGQGFNYVSSSQVLKIFREKCDELSIMVLPSVKRARTESTASGKQTLTGLDIVYTFVDVENPDDRIDIPFYAQGADQAEKGVGKALTYGEKFMILKLFNIPTDKDDPDSQQGTDKNKGNWPKDDERTTNYLKMMTKLAEKMTERDGNAKGISMVLRMKGFDDVKAVTKSEDRQEIIGLLMKELNITNMEDLLG